MFVKIPSLIIVLPAVYSLRPNSTLYNEINSYHNETNFKAEYAYQVVNKIFNSYTQWFFTVTFCEFTYFENRILKYIENFAYGYPVMLLNGCPDMNNTKVKPKINIHGETAYVVSSNDLSTEESESAIEAFIKTGVFQPRSAVIFVIKTPVEVNSYVYYEMKNHFRLLWNRRITKSVLVLWSNRLKVYTYNPFSREIIDVTEVNNVSRLLARQYDDLFGYELRLSVFRKIYTSNETGPVSCNSRLAKTVMEKINATCMPLPPRDGSTVGDLLENGTATGVTADLIDGYTDLELSSRILKNSYYGYIDTTYPLDQDELCFVVKKSLKQSTFRTILKLISTNILILLMCNVFVLIGVTLLVRQVEARVWNIDDNRTVALTVLDVIKCFIRQTVDMKFAGPVFRCVILMIMLYSLIVDCAIDGIITSAITYPRYKPDIETLSELFKSNLTFGVHNRHRKLFNNSLSDEYYENIQERIEIVNDKNIKQIIEEREFQYALLLRKTDAQYISRKPSNLISGRPIFHTVQDCPVPCSIVYGLRYGSPYLPRIHYILSHLNQGGILQHWAQTEDLSSGENHGKTLFAGNNKERKPLNFSNLKEVFIVLLTGIVISMIAFALEFLIIVFQRKLPRIKLSLVISSS